MVRMARTAAQIQIDIENVEAAITAALTGSRVQSYSIGSKSFTFTATSIDELRTLKQDLYAELDSVNGINTVLIPQHNDGL